MTPPPTKEQLAQLDAEDPLKWTRDEFEIPDARASGAKVDGKAIYFCGNSLGLLSKKAREHVLEELDTWSTSAVFGHFNHKYQRPWKYVDRPLTPHLARLVGAKESEVSHSATLTGNIHNLFTTFYKPTQKRWKIVIEKGAFPSDWYAIYSHPNLHSDVLSPEQIKDAIIPLSPREGEETLRTEDILDVLDKNGDEIAIVWLPLIQYYTGQLFDAPTLSKKTHDIGALFGLDMAHGVGNVKVELDKWNVDFAVWCTYKYLNSGPGAVGGFFIRDGLQDNNRRLAGWWGNDEKSRFEMKAEFEPTPGAKGYQHSCTNVLGSIPLLATLDIIDKAGFDNLRAKAIRLTGTLESLLRASKYYTDKEPSPNDNKAGFRILTPEAPWRGTQLSLEIHPRREGIMPRVFERMLDAGLVGDERKPYVIRLSPVVLYNTFTEVGKAVEILNAALAAEDEELAKGN
ncbi:hypothetical protein VHUM_01989 [Vanrija humicola]|uniref:Kynureninase n=1 Tax=Vanrija humicola TaxID=5417 RepID=A0A7D8YXR9_VANHU|nr:hypothetical protein VHUM_01989 [Vanrija humicola]